MKAILISIKPKWVAKILNGEKTIEIRKTIPKCDLPIDVYIYCTKDNKTKLSSNSLQYYVIDNKDYKDYLGNWNSKVVAKFTLNKVEEILPFVVRETKLGLAYELTEEKIINCQRAQLTYDEYNHYLKDRIGYAWHISNLEIFDRPKDLSEFYKVGYLEERYAVESHLADIEGCDGGVNESYVDKLYEELDQEFQLKKAPQSWCYVEGE